jgi:hypothetical protein
VRAVGQWETEIDQCVNKASFRGFDFLPARTIDGVGNIGDRAVVPAGGAESVMLIRRNHPVTAFMFPIGAKPINLTGEGKRCPVGAARLRGAQHALLQKVAKLVTASFALGILEEKRLLAMLTEKKFHAQLPRCLIMTVGDRGLSAALHAPTVRLPIGVKGQPRSNLPLKFGRTERFPNEHRESAGAGGVVRLKCRWG